MRRTFRAAAWTAATLCICTAGALAGPSIAGQSDAAPQLSYTEHGGTMLTAANLGLNDLADPDPAPQADDETASAPVVRHAIAPAAPEGALQDDQDEDARPSRSLADLVSDYAGAETGDNETECLARAVYWESKGEPLSGQLAVAEVIINRAHSGRFAPTVCGVVRQPAQFSFVRRGYIPQPPSASRDWHTAVAIAQIAMQSLADGAAPRALFFHARRVNPGWRLTRVATVGNHVFYR
jgi:N-acetylmuramoyl-L-alanine amidase